MDSLAPPPAFDPLFLGVLAPLPGPRAGQRVRLLDYTHFAVVLDLDRRLAALTGVTILGSALRDVPRGDGWHLDERVSPDEQCGPELYARNDLDRGHLVRRRDPVWGDEATARRANADTFAYPNAAPQAAAFNQSAELWLGLEDHVLEHARTYDQRLVVFTGPVFAPDDPVYRGVQIPQMFWKIAAWSTESPDEPGRLETTAYVLDQRPQLDGIDLRTATEQALAAEQPPPLGPFRTFQVPVGDVAALTGLDLGPLVGADVGAVPAVAGNAPSTVPEPSDVPGTVHLPPAGWVRLRTAADIRLAPPR
ncbi:DNA/RNA non-specific endonuclease [Sanguibacter antarcticus]|nr:DNA/RNA non-specific endonuclease [Sanguibacter antarcticus]